MYSKTDIHSKSYHLIDAIAEVYGTQSKHPVNREWTKQGSPWRKDGDWKARYSQLYTPRRLSLTSEHTQRSDRISFLSVESSPYSNMLIKLRESQRDDADSDESELADDIKRASILSPQSDIYSSQIQSRQQSQDLGGHDTMLLSMVRERGARDREEAAAEEALRLHNEDTDADDATSETCEHGLSMRMTERSVSRSRVSRISTRRDMDILSILAFNAGNVPTATHLEIPAFQNTLNTRQEVIPRWSIRRSVCPVCSQKWKDRSAIKKVKNSGLKKYSSVDVPSVKASAKLRTSITIGYNPRPTLAAVDEDAGVVSSGFRNTSASWQLTRARRFRAPKPQTPSPDAIAPPSATPLAQKDLDLRVNKFLNDEQVEVSA